MILLLGKYMVHFDGYRTLLTTLIKENIFTIFMFAQDPLQNAKTRKP